MLKTAEALPKGVLVDGLRDGFADMIRLAEAQWFEGGSPFFKRSSEGDEITSWRAQNEILEAVASNANKRGIVTAPVGGATGLLCEKGVHSGVVAPEIVRDARHFTMAAIYMPVPGSSAQTLLSLNAGQQDGSSKKSSYLFLSDDGDHYILKDTGGAVSLEAPRLAAMDRPRLVIATLSGDRLAFQENRGPITQIKGVPPELPGLADLFVGCRSHRGGLQKTLGDSVILDVMFWPHHTLLLPRIHMDDAQYAALHRHFLWSY